ncbi:hypothetical protein EKN06_14750 [Croceicoccus ponticola]|uniref:N-terminal of MaoC-like dehydratase domain-containing protein n=1 Tax=Croceicoccus ponticola TaxID=2217664 RepID=A0A437GU58_9SPHN|nr:hypothetical protein [Croceicoccus ponticola]RVQ64853.1 hypothetical protein EKN06_14750 [Croceicoccus ponticola]
MNPSRNAAPPVAGQVLAAGRYAIDDAADERIRRLAKAGPRRGDEAHAGFALALALGGIGVPIRDIFERCGLDFDAGAVLGSCSVDWDRPLTVGHDYAVTATLASLNRKASRRFGAADHLILSFAIDDEDGLCATVRTTTIVPVAKAAA